MKTVGTALDHPFFVWAGHSRTFFHLAKDMSFTERGKVAGLWCNSEIVRPEIATRVTRTPIDLRPCPTCMRRWRNVKDEE